MPSDLLASGARAREIAVSATQPGPQNSRGGLPQTGGARLTARRIRPSCLNLPHIHATQSLLAEHTRPNVNDVCPEQVAGFLAVPVTEGVYDAAMLRLQSVLVLRRHTTRL